MKYQAHTTDSKFIPHMKVFILILILGFGLCQNTLEAKISSDNSQSVRFTSQYIFPLQDLHVHSSSIIELPKGDLLCCWFEGSGERTANDVVIMGARYSMRDLEWGKPFLMADTPGHPDCNPTLFIDEDNRLHLFWIVVQANRWETSVLKSRVSSSYQNSGSPEWEWQDVILLKPGEEFAETIIDQFMESDKLGLAWGEYAPRYESMIYEAAKDPKKRETGWMTRTHPIQIPNGRILLPLYSDGFNLSLIAISDDMGETWRPGLPIVGRGNVQPSIVRKTDGTLLAYMRDNGDEPGRIMKSISMNDGYEWTRATDTDLANPGTSVEALVLENGNWIIVYNDIENGRYSLAISLSDDEGETWKWTRHLEQKAEGEGSFSYPSVIQTRDGLIHISYSFHLPEHKTIKHVAFSAEWTKEQASTIKANVAVRKLTPPLEMDYTLGGYGARMNKPAMGIHDDIWAKALVLDDGDKKYAIVTLDILGLPPNVKPQVIEQLNQEGWTEENIMFLPSHSHASLEMFALNDKSIFGIAPIGIFQPQLLDYLVNSLADLIKSADQNLKPVRIGSLSKQIDGLNRNRRGESFIDNFLTVTRIDHINGKPMTVLVNWTGHPTIMDEHDMHVSGGWPGYLQRELESHIAEGVVAMYYNGPVGDQSVIAGNAGSHYEKAEKYGRTMAVNALNVYKDIKTEEKIKFNYNYKIIQLPNREAHPDFMETGGKEYGLDKEKIMILLDQVFPEQTSIGACRLGDLLIVGAPGELIAELGLNIKDKLKARGVKYPAIGGLANQWISYILSENAYNRGGYETSASFYGKDLGKVIVKSMMETALPLIEE